MKTQECEVICVEKCTGSWGREYLTVKAKNIGADVSIEFEVPVNRAKAYSVGRTVRVSVELMK